jgi:hypothetical protein
MCRHKKGCHRSEKKPTLQHNTTNNKTLHVYLYIDRHKRNNQIQISELIYCIIENSQ